MRNPVILPRDHLLVKLLLRHLHTKRAHCGYKSLIHEARRKYWIIGLRSMSKALTAKCITCKKLRKKPLDQLMGQIPSLRVAAGFPPFSNTAIDMFGPVHIKLNRKTLKEAQVVIFACMTTRAVHLELVNDRTADAFLMAFRRFASLRGHPSVCWSDCGTNFVGAQAYLKEVMRNWSIPKIQSDLSEDFSCDFKWLWNIPHASHQMVSWKLSSSLLGKALLPARIEPLAKSNGEHSYRRQPTSSMDVLCTQVLTTSGKVHPSHRTMFS